MEKVCIICGKRFIPNPHNKGSRKQDFCSLECYWESMRLPKLKKNCIFCGKEFEQNRNTNRKSFLKQKYCSRKCSVIDNIRNRKSGELANNWKGGFIKRDYKLIEGSHTKKEWEDLKNRFNNRCVCCGRGTDEITISKDHIISIANGGDNYITNIQPLCRSCNSKKHTKNTNYIKIYDIKCNYSKI